MLGLLLLLTTALLPLSNYASATPFAASADTPCMTAMSADAEQDASGCMQSQCGECASCSVCSHCAAGAAILATFITALPVRFESGFVPFSVRLRSIFPPVDSPPPRLV
jgi:hypothetical protein